MIVTNKRISTFILTTVLVFVSQFSFAANNSKIHTNDTTIESQILVHINQYRHQRGLSALKMDDRISREARAHSRDMANHHMPFGHKHFKRRIDILHGEIKNSNAGAENVAYNYKDAQDVVKNWIRSPGHRRNIEGHYDLTGIGIARDQKGKIYFTQIFLRTGAREYAVRRSSFNFLRRSI